MAIVCPTVMGHDPRGYREAIDRVAEFAHRIHIDFADGVFAPSKLIPIEDAWWPVGLIVDFHIMYKNPLDFIEDILYQQPNLVIVHAEAEGIAEFLDELEGMGMHRGIALLKNTPVSSINHLLDKVEHVLVFSGDLGHYGGTVDYGLLKKVHELRALKPTLEIGWDGGIDQNSAFKLAEGGIDVLNVGGYIQKASDPEEAYDKLKQSIS
jgi:ribulose-phosphate 3-epimerase